MNERVVCAHGFTQTAGSWDLVITLLARHGCTDVRSVDLPGHGRAHAMRGDLWACADHLVQQGGPGTYLGYSMGGRVALHAALAHPDKVRRLVLIGATAGIEDLNERTQRRAADDALASRIESIGVESFIDEWLANPLFAGLAAADAQRADRVTNTAAGLAASLRDAGTGTQEPLWAALDDIDIPVLLIVGEHDRKFGEIAQRMHHELQHATVSVIAGAGHSAHLEQPAATVDAMVDWLASA